MAIAALGTWLAASCAAAAAATDPLALYDGKDGVTCGSFNAAGQLAWHHRGGDWRDAQGVAQGPRPFAAQTLAVSQRPRRVEFDVTALVRGAQDQHRTATSILLAAPDGNGGAAAFASREAPQAQARPQLVVEVTGSRVNLDPSADATLDCSTAYPLGSRPDLRVASASRAALEFDLSPLGGSRVIRAVLSLTASSVRDAPTRVAVFALDTPGRISTKGEASGIASRYPRDAGIAKDPDVVFATDFESARWRSEWSYVSESSHAQTISRDDDNHFEPLLGKALRVTIPAGSTLGLDMGYDFKGKLGYEPEAIYFRYYLRFADDWNPVVDGGKLPGLSATYDRAGWGGRRADPMKGWSMRGQFNRAPSVDNPMHGLVSIGTYAYHADMEDIYGDHWYWMRDARGVLERNRWYCVEQYFRVNTPGRRDGELRAWVDGGLAFEQTGLRVRETTSINIERVWMNVYHGGTAATDRNLDLYIDNVVVANKPIGCM